MGMFVEEVTSGMGFFFELLAAMDQINVSLFTSELWADSGSCGKRGERMLTDPDRISNLTKLRTTPPGFLSSGPCNFCSCLPQYTPSMNITAKHFTSRAWIFLNLCW